MSAPSSAGAPSPLPRRSLPRLLAADAVAALVSAAALSPFVTIIDRAVTQSMSGSATLLGSIGASARTLARPVAFVRQPAFLAVYAVYCGTYGMANGVTSVCEHLDTSPRMPKLWLTFGANTVLGILKDRAFARWYGTKTPGSLPAASWGLFFGRDILTIGAGFVLPEFVAAELSARGIVAEPAAAAKVAQILSPVTAQIALTPVHLLALDIYNNPTPSSARARAAAVGARNTATTVTRMIRVLFAYGAAGIVNVSVRTTLRESAWTLA